MSKNNALICGGFGYVGRHLARYLGTKGFEVHIVGRGSYPMTLESPRLHSLPPSDLLCYNQCEPLVRNMDWIFNLAADVGGIRHISTHRAAGFSAATINTNLLRAIVNTKTKLNGYFFASSSCVYGEDPERGFGCKPVNGAHECCAAFSTASEGYGQAKFFAERTCEAFKQEHGIPVRIARYHSVYGPGEYRPGKEHFVEALVGKVVRASETGPMEVTVWGDGLQKRSLLYIDDCVEGTARIMFGSCSDPINLAHPDPVTVNDVLGTLKEFSGTNITPFYNTLAAVGVKNKTADIGKLRRETGWEPRVGMRTGLEKTWEARYSVPRECVCGAELSGGCPNGH